MDPKMASKSSWQIGAKFEPCAICQFFGGPPEQKNERKMKARWIFKKTSGSSEKLTFEAFEAFGQKVKKVKKVKKFDFPGQ